MGVNSLQGFSPETKALVSSPESFRKITELAESCHLDPGLLDRLNRPGDKAREKAFSDFGGKSPEGMEVVFVANNEDVEYFVIPSDPNLALSDEHLANVTGGGSGCESSIFPSTSLSTLSSV